MKKKQKWLEFSKLTTKQLLANLKSLEQKLARAKHGLILGKQNQSNLIKDFKQQIAQIKTLINQRILEKLNQRS